jgi:hypothetical protein
MQPHLLDFVWTPAFLIAMFFAAIANCCAFLVLSRMSRIGHQVGIWRTHKEFSLYRDYWRVAPTMKWSRVPLIAGFISFVFAAAILLFSMGLMPKK